MESPSAHNACVADNGVVWNVRTIIPLLQTQTIPDSVPNMISKPQPTHVTPSNGTVTATCRCWENTTRPPEPATSTPPAIPGQQHCGAPNGKDVEAAIVSPELPTSHQETVRSADPTKSVLGFRHARNTSGREWAAILSTTRPTGSNSPVHHMRAPLSPAATTVVLDAPIPRTITAPTSPSPVRVARTSPSLQSSTYQNRTVLSAEDDKTARPLAASTRERTAPLCPRKIFTALPWWVHTRMLRSTVAVRTCVPVDKTAVHALR
mmetsp:Transcript_52796/g.140354  ORF Transcript_52796/g.140354 Transcript_52796/m.140354 type:complete len:264 (-) Transcript_52796:107-898(-)